MPPVAPMLAKPVAAIPPGPGPARDASARPAGTFLLVYDGRVRTTDLNVRPMG